MRRREMEMAMKFDVEESGTWSQTVTVTLPVSDYQDELTAQLRNRLERHW